jgi:hypothetical protein
MSAERSPRAPSLPLQEALEKALKIYAKEQRNLIPTEVAARCLGYRNAQSGAAIAAVATLRCFGLLERPKAGHLAVSADVEQYHSALDSGLKKFQLQKWMRTPAVFNAVLQEFPQYLPSVATLVDRWIKRGFSPATALDLVDVFRESAAFSEVYGNSRLVSEGTPACPELDQAETEIDGAVPVTVSARPVESINATGNAASTSVVSATDNADQIPVRLTNGRKAWLVIPSPFYQQDKVRLKAQLDLLLCDDAPNSAESDGS